jgi:hypothetical protein
MISIKTGRTQDLINDRYVCAKRKWTWRLEWLILLYGVQGCQIFLDSMYQNGEKFHRIATELPNGLKIYKLAVLYSKRLNNMSTFSNSRPSKIYPNCDFRSENIPSGNPCTDGSQLAFDDTEKDAVMTLHFFNGEGVCAEEKQKMRTEY